MRYMLVLEFRPSKIRDLRHVRVSRLIAFLLSFDKLASLQVSYFIFTQLNENLVEKCYFIIF